MVEDIGHLEPGARVVDEICSLPSPTNAFPRQIWAENEVGKECHHQGEYVNVCHDLQRALHIRRGYVESSIQNLDRNDPSEDKNQTFRATEGPDTESEHERQCSTSIKVEKPIAEAGASLQHGV